MLVRLHLSAVAAGLSVLLAGAALLAGAQLAFEGGLIIGIVPLMALAVGAVGTVIWSEVIEAHARRALTRNNEMLEQRVRERTRELRETQLEIATRLGNAVESRDGETRQHIERIGRFCERLALEVGLSPAEAEQLRHASALHDVGKVGIPDSILLKPGLLDLGEGETMKSHTTIGGQILAGSSSELLQLAETVAMSHHEHWDGSGYPRGIAGDAIPLAGRICAICDVFDALLSPRPYKPPWPIEDALTEIERLRGTQFDPQLVDAFLPLAPALHRDWFSPAEAEAVDVSAA
jgi:response regulator RpfG family c-di-GMP phosphodiesterase